MIVTTRGRYALRVILDLAEHDDGNYIPMKDVAKRQGISLKYLEQILPILTKNGIIKAVHGKGGGYAFNRDPETCTVWDVLTLTEGNMASVSCLADENMVCERAGDCRTLGMWKGLDDLVRDYLHGVTIASLIANPNTDNYII